MPWRLLSCQLLCVCMCVGHCRPLVSYPVGLSPLAFFLEGVGIRTCIPAITPSHVTRMDGWMDGCISRRARRSACCLCLGKKTMAKK